MLSVPLLLIAPPLVNTVFIVPYSAFADSSSSTTLTELVSALPFGSSAISSAAASTTASAAMSVFFFPIFLSIVLTSVMQRVDGLHLRGLVRRVQPEADADDEAEQHRNEHDRAVHLERQVKARDDHADYPQRTP